MIDEFAGYHSEWNLGSPGGWDYQRMAQEIGKFSWLKIKEKIDLDLDLDFDHPMLNPVPAFAELLLRAHKKRFGSIKAIIALLAEEETLDKVGENIRFVEYLNNLPGIKAHLIAPHKLELGKNGIYANNDKLTTIFMDFNNRVIVKLKKKYNLKPLLEAIKRGLVVNPRGMEPVGAKGVFEAITLDYKNIISESTFEKTPWTRMFYPRATIGPDGEEISDLVDWTKKNWSNIILKPVHGYSGIGIIIGQKEKDIEGGIKKALDSGDYIIQPLVPTNIWAEEFPWLDKEERRAYLKRWQTDFRCFITDKGLIGFVTRFGGIPTNVGSGGGVQSTAILRSDLSVKEAIKRLNDAIIGLGIDFLSGLEDQINNMSRQMGNVYLLGPIMSTLRPRIITLDHLEQLSKYGANLWHDAVKLEKLWLKGSLSKHVQINKEEEEIAKMAPWKGKPAIIASDGLFNFGGSLE